MNKETIDSTTPLYTLKVAAELSGTSVHSIRQYIDKGLLIPFKTETKRHLFSQVDIQRLKCIRRYLDDLGLNIAGIKAQFALVPCWKVKPCSESDRQNCEAYTALSNPCWEATVKGPKCKNEDCRLCNVYKLPEKCNDLKSFLKLLDV